MRIGTVTINKMACTHAALGFLLAMSAAAGSAQELRLQDLEGQIVFSSNRSGPWRIWIIEASSSDARQLTEDGDSNVHDADPVFSPDGATVLFSSTRGASAGIWTVSAKGGNPTRLCDGDQAEWSPDGAQIALRRNNRLWVRELSSGAERALVPEDGSFYSGPAWAPDGKTIAFAARSGGANAIYLIPADGGTPSKLYDKKGACEPHFSRDGQLIVYETETNICTIQPDGEKNRMVTYQGGVQRYGRGSPDGKYVVYCQGSSEQGPWELYVVPIKGGVPVKLTGGSSDMNPDWR